MYSKHHFLISVAVGAVVAAATSSAFPWWFLVGYAAVVGVGIDFDHFLVARVNTGEWTAVERCLRDPRIVFLDQNQIFETGDVGVLRRLFSHVVIVGVAVAVLAFVSPFLAAFTALVLYAHILSDLVWDLYEASDDEESESAASESREPTDATGATDTTDTTGD